MRWLKHFLVGLCALLALFVVAVYLTPLDTYVPKMEQVLSEQLGEPVNIQKLRIVALPLPHVELQGVRIGGQEGIAARSVKVEPDLPALLAGKLAVRRILVQDGTASLVQVRKLAGLSGDTPAPTSRVALHELQFSGVSLLIPDMDLNAMDGKLEFTQTGGLERAWFSMDGQKVTATLLPLPGHGFSVKAQARGWAIPRFPQFPLDDLQVEGTLGKQDFDARKFSFALRGIHATGSGKVDFSEGWRVQAVLAEANAPLEQIMALMEKPVELSGAISVKGVISSKADTLDGLKDNFRFSGVALVRHAKARIAAGLQHPLAFDQIKAHVVAQPEYLKFSELEARLYGGKLSGTANISRRNTLLVADVAASGIAMKSLVEALTNEVLFTGDMDGKAKFSMRLDAFERFPENLQLTGNFHLRNGVLTRVDLEQVAKNSGKTATPGGATRFNDLTGLITIDANGYHFRQLKIASGSLNADGKVDISPSLQLRGTLDTRIKGTAGLVSMPMVISGTLDNPVIGPSGSVLAGAAVGTAILGPGLGTAIGIKIGGFLNRLFGKNDDNEDSKEAAPQPPARK